MIDALVYQYSYTLSILVHVYMMNSFISALIHYQCGFKNVCL